MGSDRSGAEGVAQRVPRAGAAIGRAMPTSILAHVRYPAGSVQGAAHVARHVPRRRSGAVLQRRAASGPCRRTTPIRPSGDATSRRTTCLLRQPTGRRRQAGVPADLADERQQAAPISRPTSASTATRPNYGQDNRAATAAGQRSRAGAGAGLQHDHDRQHHAARLALASGGNGAQVVHGNLLTLPLGKSFLYVEPLYTMSADTGGGVSRACSG